MSVVKKVIKKGIAKSGLGWVFHLKGDSKEQPVHKEERPLFGGKNYRLEKEAPSSFGLKGGKPTRKKTENNREKNTTEGRKELNYFQ